MLQGYRLAVIAVAFCASIYAQNAGFQVDGTCVAGSCPPQLLAYGGNFNLPVSYTIDLANGDTYSITGTLTSSNSGSGGTFALTYLFEVVFLHGAGGGASQSDTLTLDAFTAFQSSFTTGNFGEALEGAFSFNVASSSSVQLCTAGVCTATVTPPGSFNTSASYSIAPSNGGFTFDNTFSVHFGAGSAPGSYMLFNFPALPAPSVNHVINAGAYGGASTISPGSWIEIYGSNLAVGTRVWGSADFNGVDAPTSLGGTSVTIGGQAAFVDYVSSGQVNVQVPSGVGNNTQPVVVTTAAGGSTAFAVNVAATSPGLLAPPAPSTGSSPGFNVAGTQYVVALLPDGTYVLPPGAISGINSRRANPGDTITLYGIGFGPVTPAIAAGQIEQQTNQVSSPLSIAFGNTPATTIAYSGLAPNYVGLYQFNVVVPNVAASDQVPLTFSLGGASGSQTLYIAVQ
jgi:uncharacterized protein (TIGR03437 family)